MGFFAGTALLLTVAGIYSVVAFGVAQRTREFGVRLALGATAERIFALVLREGLTIVFLGAVGGILVSLIISELLAAQLYGVSPRDPVALAAAVLLIAVVAFLACWLPARCATRVDPWSRCAPIEDNHLLLRVARVAQASSLQGQRQAGCLRYVDPSGCSLDETALRGRA